METTELGMISADFKRTINLYDIDYITQAIFKKNDKF